MLNGIPFLNDSDLRAKPYDRVLPLLDNPCAAVPDDSLGAGG